MVADKKKSTPDPPERRSLLKLSDLTRAQRRQLQSRSRPDEISATLGIVNMLTTMALALKFPAHYWIWHLMHTVFYCVTRFVRFRARKWELYLLDWCYVVTYITNFCAILAFLRVTFGITTVLVHYNAEFIYAGFAMACGPLAWSVFVFRNSVVFHDVDHATSVFIHLSPFVLVWCLRWGAGQPSVIHKDFPGMFMVCESEEDFAAADVCLQSLRGMLWCDACYARPSSFVIPPLILYLVVWAVPYYLVVLVWWRDWCEKTNRETLYSYFCQAQPDLQDWCARKVEPLVGKRNAGPTGYMVLHFVSMISLCSTAFVLWHSFLLHSLLLVTILVKAVDNGSSYMFRVFAYRYAQEQLDQHRDKLEKLE